MNITRAMNIRKRTHTDADRLNNTVPLINSWITSNTFVIDDIGDISGSKMSFKPSQAPILFSC